MSFCKVLCLTRLRIPRLITWHHCFIFIISEIEFESEDFILAANTYQDALYIAPLTCLKVFRFTPIKINATIDKPRGMSYDPVERKMYWAEAGNNFRVIRRSDLNGSNVEDVVTGINRKCSYKKQFKYFISFPQ